MTVDEQVAFQSTDVTRVSIASAGRSRRSDPRASSTSSTPSTLMSFLHMMDQSERNARAERAARVWQHARAIWRTDEAAYDFLHRPHMFLDGRKPLEMAMTSEADFVTVEELLGRIEYGVYS